MQRDQVPPARRSTASTNGVRNRTSAARQHRCGKCAPVCRSCASGGESPVRTYQRTGAQDLALEKSPPPPPASCVSPDALEFLTAAARTEHAIPERADDHPPDAGGHAPFVIMPSDGCIVLSPDRSMPLSPPRFPVLDCGSPTAAAPAGRSQLRDTPSLQTAAAVGTGAAAASFRITMQLSGVADATEPPWAIRFSKPPEVCCRAVAILPQNFALSPP